MKVLPPNECNCTLGKWRRIKIRKELNVRLKQAAANAAPRGTNVATINSNLPYAPYVCKFYAVKTTWRGNVVKVRRFFVHHDL